jgi:thiosulfate/3-mercaptopyruvate sulfurtransferase
MKALRIRPTDEIVVYDALGIFSSARCAWMLRFFGAENVRILNGGMKKWLAEGRPTYTGG